MSIHELLARLHALNINVWAEGDKLRVSAPKGTITPELRDELAQQKAPILALLREQEVAEVSADARIQPTPRDGPLPLSFQQQRLWFLNQMEPGNAAYNIVGAVRLSGPLDPGILQTTLDEIVRRHETLRTVFVTQDGQPFQQIRPPEPVLLARDDLSFYPMEEGEPAALRIVTEESARPFDLENGPLFRARLLYLGPQEYVLVLSMHHIIADGWSTGIIAVELQALYTAFQAGQPSPLPALPIQYADYAHWQGQWLRGPALERKLAYWKEALRDSQFVLELPTDHPRPAEQTFRGALVSQVFPLEAAEALKKLGRQENATLFMVMAAAFQTLLHRYTGQASILIGTPVANRAQLEIERLVGFFANTLVLRTDFDGEPTFRTLLRRVREGVMSAFAHQDIPFELLVEALHPARDTGHSPIFQVMILFQNTPMSSAELPGIKSRPVMIDTGTAKYDLTLHCAETPEGLALFLEYNTDLFERETIVRMLRHLEVLLESIIRDPDQKLAGLPMLPGDEQRRLLVDWNDTAATYPQELCIHQLFEAQAARTPDAIAVAFGDARLTYRELDQKANRLAQHLRRLGVGPETLAGVSLERSHEMVVAVLGILKAGGAYVPLDPSFPAERLAYVMQDARVRVVVTQAKYAADSIAAGALPVCLDQDADLIAAESAEPLAGGATPDNRAYVLYTSGSTGRPKGVEITHRAVVNFLASMQRAPGLAARDTLLSVTTLSFDIAGLEIYLPLMVGACVVIAPQSATLDGAELRTLLRLSGATVMQATPTTWQLLLKAGWSAGERLEKVLCGGEALPRPLAEQLLERCDELWNMYGPTETTIWSTCCRVQKAEPVITIGRPIANTQVYILDSQARPVPIGVAGELYIGGDGLARGYLNRPELTAEKFVPDPFRAATRPDEPKPRLYRTGDLARFLPDGRILFLGRMDHQVKLRGFRIELGEIETQLQKQPGIREAVVVARHDGPGEGRLVAYLIADRAPAPSTDQLRDALRQQLPDYMVPAAFMFMKAFPLTPNKKVDRKALPEPDSERPELQATYLAPQNQMEATIAGIWQEILKRDLVGVNDNFFDLGGHSLLIVQVQSRLKKVLNRDLTVADMFRYPTVSSLARYLTQSQDERHERNALRDRVEKQREALPPEQRRTR